VAVSPHTQNAQAAASPTARRHAIVAEAIHTTRHHACAVCDAGDECETMAAARKVIALDQMLDNTDPHPLEDYSSDEAFQSGRLEAMAQALAIIGKAEGEARAEADGDPRHPALNIAETLRRLGMVIKSEIAEPDGRTVLEIVARQNEANELSDYVHELSKQYRASNSHDLAAALDNVASDIAKGSEGVSRLRQASNVNTDPEILTELTLDSDPDVRWWAAQNESTPAPALMAAIEQERHPTVLAALLVNPHVPDEAAEIFLEYPHAEVAGAAKRRLGR
jgi:hypothetical protein